MSDHPVPGPEAAAKDLPSHVQLSEATATTEVDEDNGSSSRLKIYTRSGDTGVSSLYNGTRLPKDSDYFCALGDIDELNSTLGIAHEFCDSTCAETAAQLEVVQSRLFDVGSAVATPANSSSQAKIERTKFDAASTRQLEAWIDAMDTQLPALKNFILPSGGRASAFLHQARAICRRAERSVVPLTRDSLVDEQPLFKGCWEAVGSFLCFFFAEHDSIVQVAIYLNRLSDYLFTAARLVAKLQGSPEVIYKKGM